MRTEPKAAQSQAKGREGNSELNYRLSEHFAKYRGDNATSRIVDMYCAILKNVKLDHTFEDTIQLLTSLGMFSSVLTKTELRVLYDTHISQLQQKGGCDA